MDRGAWQAIAHGLAKSQTQLSTAHTHTEFGNFALEEKSTISKNSKQKFQQNPSKNVHLKKVTQGKCQVNL